MKKFIYALFTIVMLLSIIPFATSAEETAMPSKPELIIKACNIFPEYANVIRGENLQVPMDRAFAAPVVTTNITRDISDSETMTYTEYSDGTAYITLAEWKFDADVTDAEVQLGNNATYHTVSFAVTCNMGDTGTFYLNDLQYTVHSYDYDEITNEGSSYADGCYAEYFRKNLKENATTDAYVQYVIEFYSAYSSKNTYFTFSLRNNSASMLPNDDSF